MGGGAVLVWGGGSTSVGGGGSTSVGGAVLVRGSITTGVQCYKLFLVKCHDIFCFAC